MRTVILKAASVLLTATTLGSIAAPALADSTFPNRPMRWIVPFPAGGTTDVTARRAGERLAKVLGQPVTIDNRPGAGGMLGTELAANAAPDGYTWIYGTSGTMAANLSLYSNVRYDPFKDFTPVHSLFETPLILVVPSSRPYKNVSELVAYLKANAGKVNYSSAGAGTATHLTGELFKTVTGTQITHVPYKGSSPALNDLMAGRIDMMFDYGQVVGPLIAGGKLRPIAVTSSSRLATFKDIPTVAESGYPGFESSAWAAILMPAKTPPAITKKVADEVAKMLGDSKFIEPWIQNGSSPVNKSGEELTKFMRAEYTKWAEVIKQSGAKLE